MTDHNEAYVIALISEAGIEGISQTYPTQEQAQDEAQKLTEHREKILEDSGQPYGPFEYKVAPESEYVVNQWDKLAQLKSTLSAPVAKKGASKKG